METTRQPQRAGTCHDVRGGPDVARGWDSGSQNGRDGLQSCVCKRAHGLACRCFGPLYSFRMKIAKL